MFAEKPGWLTAQVAGAGRGSGQARGEPVPGGPWPRRGPVPSAPTWFLSLAKSGGEPGTATPARAGPVGPADQAPAPEGSPNAWVPPAPLALGTPGPASRAWLSVEPARDVARPHGCEGTDPQPDPSVPLNWLLQNRL